MFGFKPMISLSLLPELPVGGAQPELPVSPELPSALLLLILLHVLLILLFLAAGTGDRPAAAAAATAAAAASAAATAAATAAAAAAAAAARHDGRTWVSTWWVKFNINTWSIWGHVFKTLHPVASFLCQLIHSDVYEAVHCGGLNVFWQ